MSPPPQQIETLYEISVSIEPRETLKQTVVQALHAYIDQLDCDVGAVFRTVPVDDGVEVSTVCSVPPTFESSDLLCTARDRLDELFRSELGSTPRFLLGHDYQVSSSRDAIPEVTDDSDETDVLATALPIAEQAGELGGYYLMNLPGFGVIVLGADNGTIESQTIAAVQPLNAKLARACQVNETTHKLKEKAERLEAVFDAIPEPVVNVVIDDGTERIRRANEAFKTTFIRDERSLRGEDLNELIVPEDASPDTEGLITKLNAEKPLTEELERQTTAGTGHFLFNAVPVGKDEPVEYFGVYTDITDQKHQEQTLEELYTAAEDILTENSRQQVCEQTVDVTKSVLEYPDVSIHLYNRDSEALEPVAYRQTASENPTKPPAYTEKQTPFWQAYERDTVITIDDTSEFNGPAPGDEAATERMLVLPIGAHGILVVSASERNEFPDDTVRLFRLLRRLVTIALDRTVTTEGLVTAQQAIRETLHATTHEEMVDVFLRKTRDLLDLSAAGIWKHQPARQRLEPVDQTEQADELIGEQPVFAEGDSIAWESFSEQSTSIISNVADQDNVHNPETPLKGEIYVPIGDFGIFVAGSTRKDSFTQLEAEIFEVLMTNLEIIAELIDNRQDNNLLDQVIARILRHNVRNDLTPINGYANTIVEEGEGEVETYAETILEKAEELEQTTEHAREMRDIVKNRDRKTEISLGTQVRAAAIAVDEEFPEGELCSHIKESSEVKAHPQLGTAIQHLLRNGFEHNDSDTPKVAITVEQRSTGPTIEISDNGPGIGREELAILETNGESVLEHGSGVGLWIVDRIIEYSEALIEFDPVDGTTVTMNFEPNY